MVQWSGPFFTYPLDEPQLETYLQTSYQNPPPRRIYKAVDLERGDVVGHIELNNIDRRNNTATLSKVLVGDPQLRGHGIGTMMARCLLAVAFDEMHLHRIDLHVFDWNTAAVKSYQKIGFIIEGHLRDYRKVGDTYWSSYLMSILQSDWQIQKSEDGQDVPAAR